MWFKKSVAPFEYVSRNKEVSILLVEQNIGLGITGSKTVLCTADG
jgi:ABC-type branched-subunit amino acid transport system ATPase component